MLFCQKFEKLLQFFVLFRLPAAGKFEDGKKPCRILPQMFGEVIDKNIRPQPIEIAMVFLTQNFITRRAGFSKIRQSPGADFGGPSVGGVVGAK